MKKENKKNELAKIDVIINGYKFSILENHPGANSKYRIVHSGVYPEGAQFGANYVYNTIDKANIRFRLFNLAETNVLVSTTDTISNPIEEFSNSTDASTYTQTNKVDWTDNGYGIPQWDIDFIEYIQELDN